MADLDPLGEEPAYNPELDPLTYGLTIWDLDRHFYTGTLQHAFGGRKQATLREMIDLLRATYCGKIGCEYMYIQRPEEKLWLQQQHGTAGQYAGHSRRTRTAHPRTTCSKPKSSNTSSIAASSARSAFRSKERKPPSPFLPILANLAADQDAQEIVIGMAHRGRLNVLANIIGKPLGQIFSEFEGNIDPASAQGSGDVKYHLGASGLHRSHPVRKSWFRWPPIPAIWKP